MSSDSVTEVTEQSWFGRMGDAIKSVLLGLVLFAVSFPLLWWNEGRAVRTAKALAELGGSAISIPRDQIGKVNPDYDKKAVHLTGEATTEDILTDPVFPVKVPAIKLLRKVEMYQWREKEESNTQKKLGGGTRTEKTYTYDKAWSDKLVDSKPFKQAAGHENPGKMRYETYQLVAKQVQLGAFVLSPGLVAQINNFEPLAFKAESIEKLPPDDQKTARVADGLLYLPTDVKGDKPDPVSPKLGDLRITFEAAKPAEVSVMAKQIGQTFEAWQASSAKGMGTTVERLEMGAKSAEQMVGEMETENVILVWALRLAGFLLMAFGLGMIFNPLAVLADVLPILGDLLRMGIGLFAAVWALAMSLVTIAVAWLYYRPLLGVGLIVAAILLVVALKRLGRGKRVRAAAA